MRWRELGIEGAWEITPEQHADDRGVFLETFRADLLAERTGRRFELAQANTSVSAAGVVRGIHLTSVPPGQAKYVTCPRGAVLDVVVDLRLGSPTFGRWESVLLDDVDRRAVLVTEGLGHAFCSLEDGSTTVYLCTSTYAPEHDHAIDAFDPEIGIIWPSAARDGSPMALVRSTKDQSAPSLSAARASGTLPSIDDVTRHLAGQQR